MFRHRSVMLLVALAAALWAGCGGVADPTTTPAPTPTTAIITAPPATSPAPTSAPTTAAPPETTTTTTTTAATPTTATPGNAISVTVIAGTVTGPGRAEVPRGEDVTITVTADVTDEVHVHGYDLLAVVSPDAPAVIEFTATIPGIFEVELEGAHLELLLLEVR